MTMLHNYLNLCQWITPYLVATIGILFLIAAAALLAILASHLVCLACVAWVKRFKIIVANYGALKDFTEWRKVKRKGNE